MLDLLLNSASDDDDDESLSISLSGMEKETNNNSHSHHCTMGTLSSSGASSLTMPSPNRPLTPIMSQGLIIPPPPSDSIINIKSQRPSTPSNHMDDKDGNDSEGIEYNYGSKVDIGFITGDAVVMN